MAVLAVRGLSFAYRRNGEELLGGLDWQFTAGAVTGVTGESGRGKSTLLYLLGLLLRPRAGQVLFEQTPVHRLPDAHRARLRARRIGFVFQDAVLDSSRTILDAVIEPALYAGGTRTQASARARELLSRFGVALRADHRPGEISGGQAQRVALCRALVNDPVVLLADEPTGNLDRANADMVLAALREQAMAGCTVVIATHDPFVLEHVDTLITLR
jgi:putative ABC transport system ATP-binding protein/lipoprotein-releasing system ATP-binding protein